MKNEEAREILILAKEMNCQLDKLKEICLKDIAVASKYKVNAEECKIMLKGILAEINLLKRYNNYTEKIIELTPRKKKKD